MIKIPKFFVEFFLDRMQQCFLLYFVCDNVSAINSYVQPNMPRGILKMPYLLIGYTHDAHAYTHTLVANVMK